MSKISLTFDTKKDNMVEVEYQYLKIKLNDMIFLLYIVLPCLSLCSSLGRLDMIIHCAENKSYFILLTLDFMV